MKKYVKVTATFDCDGDLIPEYIVWDDGDTALTKFPMCGMRRLSKQAVREYATPAIFSAKNDTCFWRKTGGLSMPNNKRRIICIRSKQKEFCLPQTA